MNSLIYILRFVWRIRWWLLIGPLLAALGVYVMMGRRAPRYTVTTTVYTGIVSGYDINTVAGTTHQDWNIINNAMDNLINIITSQSTLHDVSMALYAQDLVHGDEHEDNNYILASNYRTLRQRTPPDVLRLVDRSSDSITRRNLLEYEQADHDNHVYGIFRWKHRHYSYEALSKIKVRRLNNSDMLEISYTNDDPGITYNTLVLLNREFVNQYKKLRFGEINNVIGYFEGELARVAHELRVLEDSLTIYNVDNRVINYGEQTKHIAAMERDFELRLQDIMLSRDGSKRLVESIESKIEGLQNFRNNALFVQKLQEISNLYSRLAATESFEADSVRRNDASADRLKQLLDSQSRDLASTISAISSQQYTKEGIATSSIVQQWLDAVLLNEKSKAELRVMEERKRELDKQYGHFAPIGSTLQRKERNIEFLKQSYLSILQALNEARLRQKGLQMSSATLKVINPPVVPISAEPTKRKLMVIAAFLVAAVFVTAFFVLLELLDRTLREKTRAERITGGKVLGAFPRPPRWSGRRYAGEYDRIATQFLSNSVIDYFRPGRQNLVGLLSTEPGDGKSYLGERLAAHLRDAGLKVRFVSWNRDFDCASKEFLLAGSPEGFIPERDASGDCPLAEADAVIVEYPPLARCTVPAELLQAAAVNLMVVRANRTWKDTDQLLYEKTVATAGGGRQAPLFLYLNGADREAVETFTGLLPPRGWLRRFGYKIYQFGFTSTDL